MTATIKVFVVDDHELVRRGIVALLRGRAGHGGGG